MIKIKEAQLLITRKCNNDCSYCGLTHGHVSEINLNGWKKVVSNTKKLGIDYFKILGGEPMTRAEDVFNLINYIKQESASNVTLASNSLWDNSLIDRLCSSGLDVYASSLNTFKPEGSLDIKDFLKSQAAYQKLITIKGKVGKVYADIIVSSKNLDELVSIATSLSSDGIPSYLFPIICGECNTNYESRTRDTPFKLKEVDREKVKQIMHTLINMKEEGALILNTNNYLENMHLYGLEGGSWKCKQPTELRIDADGSVMLCNDIRGEISDRLNLAQEDIASPIDWWQIYYQLWHETRKKTNCQCYWPCFLNSSKDYFEKK